MHRWVALLLWLAIGYAPMAGATVRETVAAGYWTNAVVWTDGILPVNGDTAIVNHALTLDEATPALDGFVNHAPLIFNGWDTRIEATTVSVNANLTHPAQTATTAPWIADQRVWIICSNLTVSATGTINVNHAGWLKGFVHGAGHGPGGGGHGNVYRPGGGGHGGRGGDGDNYPSQGTLGGSVNGSTTAPESPGSGGGSRDGIGGNGGGVVRIEARGHVTVDGNISANGETPVGGQGAGGAGGSIYITCRTFGGTGTIRAIGGDYGRNICGPGGGGRITVAYDVAAQASVTPDPSVRFEVQSGRRLRNSEPGTLHLPDNRFFLEPTTRLISGNNRDAKISIPAFTDWAPVDLTISNAWIWLLSVNTLSPTNGLTLRNSARLTLIPGATVATGGDTIIRDSSRLTLGTGASIRAGGDLMVTHGAWLSLSAAATNAASPANDVGVHYGARLDAAGTLTVAQNSILYLASEPRNGGSVFITARDARVDGTSRINADGLGYRQGEPWGSGGPYDGYGPGGGKHHAQYRGGGAGYGGRGGQSNQGTTFGGPYGSNIGPGQPGSGGPQNGHRGGGLVWLDVSGTVLIDGAISANGDGGTGNGGGSGGGIDILCRHLTGGGILSARGGNASSNNGGGGGGRIMVWIWPHYYAPSIRAGILSGQSLRWATITDAEPYHPDFSPGADPVIGGSGYEAGTPGTVRFVFVNVPGTMLSIR